MKSLPIAFAMKKKKKMAMQSGDDSMPESAPSAPMGMDPDEHDMVKRVMMKRKMMAEGGLVADETTEHADSMDADYDYLSSGDLDDHSTNSGEADGDLLGNHQEEEDRKDIVARIMKQRSMKSRNPSPA